MSRTVLVVAAHTDDEALGCGGTIARHVAEGDAVYAVFMADGVSSRSDSQPEDLEKRMEAASKAHKILILKEVFYLGLPDNRMDSIPLLDVVHQLETIIQKVLPEVVYTHHHGDLNIDHRITHQAVVTACRPLPSSSVCEIYGFELLSSTEWATPQLDPFVPDFFTDISDFMEVKLEALKAYQLEMRETPHSRSIEHAKHLAHHRGHSVGVTAAEAFSVIRIIR